MRVPFVAALLGLAAGSALAQSFPPCPSTLVRREIRDLERGEFETLVATVKELMAKSGPDNYDSLVELHLTHKMAVHGTVIFLSWHRWFVKKMENALRDIKPVVLPYWAWEYDARSPQNSVIFTKDYYGGNGVAPDNCIKDGAHYDFKPKHRPAGTPPCITRKFENGGRMDNLATVEEIASLISRNKDFTSFRNALEGYPHGRVHNCIGGGFSTMSSPNDFVFWLHHANVDRIYYNWQKAHPEAAHSLGKGVADTRLPPWGYMASSAFDTQAPGLCYRYDPPVAAARGSSNGNGGNGGGRRNRRRSANEEVEHHYGEEKPQEEEHHYHEQQPESAQPEQQQPEGDHKAPCHTETETEEPAVDYGDLTKVGPVPPLSKEWCEMNHLNETDLREHERHGREVRHKLNNNPNYISQSCLYNRDELVERMIRNGENKDFSAYIGGHKFDYKADDGQDPRDAIHRAKEGLLEAGFNPPVGEAAAKALESIIGKDGLVAQVLGGPVPVLGDVSGKILDLLKTGEGNPLSKVTDLVGGLLGGGGGDHTSLANVHVGVDVGGLTGGLV